MSREKAIVEVKKALGEGGIELADDKAGAVADALNEKGELSVEELETISGGFKWSGLTAGQKRAIQIAGATVSAIAVVAGGTIAWTRDVGGVRTMMENRGRTWVPAQDAVPGGLFGWGARDAVPGHYED